jgi:hypothetical protein
VLRERLINEILSVSLADNVRAQFLDADGSYRRPRPDGTKAVRSQSNLPRWRRPSRPVPARVVPAATRCKSN